MANIEQELAHLQNKPLTYEQMHTLVEDMFVSWQFLRINLGEGELKTYHEERFNYLKDILTPYWNEINPPAGKDPAPPIPFTQE